MKGRGACLAVSSKLCCPLCAPCLVLNIDRITSMRYTPEDLGIQDPANSPVLPAAVWHLLPWAEVQALLISKCVERGYGAVWSDTHLCCVV